MPDWGMSMLAALQRSAVSGLAAEIRSGGWLAIMLAFALGALHALTPGHGKAALTAYFLGQDSRAATGLRVALTASALHVVMGFAAFVVLQLVLRQMPHIGGRASVQFAAAGYALIALSGLMMFAASLRPLPAGTHRHSLTFGIGLLPCPLTIGVLGFAWTQGTGPMIAAVLVSLALGIAFTIGAVALAAILLRHVIGAALNERLSGIERWSRILQGAAGMLIVAVAVYSIVSAL